MIYPDIPRAPAISIFTSVSSEVLFIFDIVRMMNKLTDYFGQENTTLRSVKDKDIHDLVDIINEAYSYQDAVKGRPRTDSEHLSRRIKETDFYVLEKDKKILGCVYLEPQSDSLHFGLLTLTPALRKTGLGKVIMEAIEAYAKGNNYTALELDYMSLAPWLKEYYERYGFEENGEITKWGSIDLIRMQKKI
jgi:N-acetylglutamate synthase-like GNAT family acetyltransferase